eukprot:TRINITY_DN54123_c1_g1_i1.p1 TRINITY_DN54123_c1_g1~~TRINITY_DN54123_c1_g1_i1.p1  ORF type:complete len:438 (+),score=254.08 TRINITY_DN54123_c1_g1_i1:146-1459(+)
MSSKGGGGLRTGAQLRAKRGRRKRKAEDQGSNDSKKAKTQTKKTAAAGSNTNAAIVKILNELGANEKANGKDYKALAYFKAARSLKNHPTAIKSGKEAMKLPGIGKKIGAKIDEILTTGGLERLERDRNDERLQSIQELQRVSGIGPRLAQKLYDEHKVKSLADLYSQQHLLNDKQRICLRHVKEFEEKIPRAEMDEISTFVQRVAKQVDPELMLTTCGSYRRGVPESGDIDILVTRKSWRTRDQPKPKSMQELVKKLKDTGFLTDDLADGPAKYRGVCILPERAVDKQAQRKANEQKKKSVVIAIPDLSDEDDDNDDDEKKIEVVHTSGNGSSRTKSDVTVPVNKKRVHRRIDLQFLPYNSYYYGILYFTGSGEFNRQMRGEALSQDYKLNEYSLRKIVDTTTDPIELGDPVEVHSEQEIFDKLGMAYVKPEDRSI